MVLDVIFHCIVLDSDFGIYTAYQKTLEIRDYFALSLRSAITKSIKKSEICHDLRSRFAFAICVRDSSSRFSAKDFWSHLIESLGDF